MFLMHKVVREEKKVQKHWYNDMKRLVEKHVKRIRNCGFLYGEIQGRRRIDKEKNNPKLVGGVWEFVDLHSNH